MHRFHNFNRLMIASFRVYDPSTPWRYKRMGDPESSFVEDIRDLPPPYILYRHFAGAPSSAWNDPARERERLWWRYCYWCQWPMERKWDNSDIVENYVCVACKYVKCSHCQLVHERDFEVPEQQRIWSERRSLGETTDVCFMCKDQVPSLLCDFKVTTSTQIATRIASFLTDLTDGTSFISQLFQ